MNWQAFRLLFFCKLSTKNADKTSFFWCRCPAAAGSEPKKKNGQNGKTVQNNTHHVGTY